MKKFLKLASLLSLVAASFAQQPAPLQLTQDQVTCPALVKYAGDNAPKAPSLAAATVSTDPAVFVGQGMEIGGYIYKINRTSYVAQVYGGGIDGRVNGSNQQALNAYSAACHEWEQHKDSVNLPNFPRYLYFDPAAFDQWWLQYTANIGQDAPPLFFDKPAPLLPAVVIIPSKAASAPAPASASSSPIGKQLAPGLYDTAGAADVFPDGFVFPDASGNVYQKHVYSNPFTAGQTRVLWIQIAGGVK